MELYKTLLMHQGDNMKSKAVAILLAIFLGSFGFHKFYLGKVGQGLVYLLFFWTIVPGLIGFIEGLLYATYSEERWNKDFNNLDSSDSQSSRKRKCPECAEVILSEAKKCKHCGSVISQAV